MNLASGLDFPHAELALSELAKFHVLGIVCKQRRPTFFEQAQKPIEATHMSSNSGTEKNGFKKNLCADPRLAQYEDRINQAFSRDRKTVKQPNNIWMTFNHGDFWVNNMMFSYDESEKPIGIKFIDFQISNYNTSLRDILYFIFTSCNKELVANNLDELLTIYHKSFFAFLARFKIDSTPYSKESFDKQLKEEAGDMFVYITCALKFMTLEVGQDVDLNNMIAEVLLGKSGKDFTERVNVLVQQFVKRSWI